MTDTRPGFWDSPITPEMLAQAGVRLGFSQPFAGDVFWDESRPSEGGRVVVVSERNGDILPPPWSAKTRVHEMGGLSWLVTQWAGQPGLLFCEATDQRIYWKTPGGSPEPVTPPSPEGVSWRYCDLVVVGDEVWCIREADRHGATTRAIVAVSRDGSVRTLDSDSHFYAHVTLSPDGGHLAWVCWEHPDMPWDTTELRVARIDGGALVERRTLLGGPGESVQSPAWADTDTVCVVSDRSGWWNPWLVPLGGRPRPLVTESREWGQPLWLVGWRTLQRVRDGLLVAARGGPAACGLVTLEVASGLVTELPVPVTYVESLATDAAGVTAFGEGPRVPGAVIAVDLDTRSSRTVMSLPVPVAPEWLPGISTTSVSTPEGHLVHVIVHEPTNPHHADAACAPTIITAHGGPTGHSQAAASLGYAFFTSRGFRVVAVNYRGSTGYGRAYRDALKTQWGVADTQDVLAVAHHYSDPPLTPAGGLFIRGGSAGGFAVLNALVHSDLFDGGINYYGVADLVPLAQDTHDFESRYLDSLVGPYPELAEVYRDRSPVTHAAQVTAPLLILQGADDPIVPPSQSEAFRDACLRNGIPCEYHVFAGESHGFRQAQTLIACAGFELGFLQTALARSAQ